MSTSDGPNRAAGDEVTALDVVVEKSCEDLSFGRGTFVAKGTRATDSGHRGARFGSSARPAGLVAGWPRSVGDMPITRSAEPVGPGIP